MHSTGSNIKLHERQRELAAIEDLLDRLGAGEGGVAFIEGALGIGKTALLLEAARAASARGFQVLEAAGSAYEGDFDSGVVRQLLEPAVGAAEIDEALADTGGPCAVMRRLCRCVYMLAERGPVLVVLDDAQWLDDLSLRWLNFLIRRLEDQPVLVAVASRTSSSESIRPLREATSGRAVVLTPEPLSEQGAHALLTEAFSQQPEAEFTRRAVEATGGNPFLLGELAHALAVDGAGPQRASLASLLGAAPEAIARRVLVRVGHLAEPERKLAQAVAVFGAGASLADAASAAGLEPQIAAEAADRLVSSAVFTPDCPLRFTYELARAAVYADLGPGRRALLHGRAASLLNTAGESPEVVAAHLLLAEPEREPAVVEQLQGAARAASARGAPATAAAYLRRALAEPPPGDLTPRILVDLAGAEATAAEPSAAPRLAAAFAAAEDAGMRAEVLALDAGFLLGSGYVTETLAMVEKVAAECSAGDGHRPLELEAQYTAAALVDPDRTGDAAAWLERVGDAVQGDDSGERAVLSQIARHRAWTATNAAMAVDLARRALGGPSLLEDGRLVPHRLEGALTALICAGELDLAAGILDGLEAVDGVAESRRAAGFLASMRAQIAYRSGALADAEAAAREAIAVTTEAGLVLEAVVPTACLVQCLVEMGRLEEAASVLEQSAGLSPELERYAPSALLLGARGKLRVAAGDIDGGLVDLLECGWRCRRFGIRNPMLAEWRRDAIRVHWVRGDLVAARLLVDEELTAACNWGTDEAIGGALRTAASIASGSDAAIATLREAEEHLRRAPATLELARTLADLGAAMRLANRRVDARSYLSEAADLAAGCGAAALSEHIDPELRATGARPRSFAPPGVESLTESERRVASLAAKGKSNLEIARTLLVSRRTVEAHLGHVYGKLGIASRGQLADVLPAAA
jgi:DNA-binding CsgD family transcriptional regulator